MVSSRPSIVTTTMNAFLRLFLAVSLGTIALAPGLSPGQEPSPAPPTPAPPAPAGTPVQDGPPLPPGVTVQARGPVHEAFARPADAAATAGPVAPKEPPAPIRELPPDHKPEADGVQWIPGYWAWDDQARDFIWVSGCWRIPPPGRDWVNGKWVEVPTGWQWVSGYWGGTGRAAPQTIDNTPPKSLEVGPSTPPQNRDSFYTPGEWVYQDGNWVWRPGSWVQNRPGLVYIPPSYVRTPTGSIIVPGYWDYPLEDRGVLFAPVAIAGTPWVGDPSWGYQPGYIVGLGGLYGSLFSRPGNGSYYFGNYFGGANPGLGYVPWSSYGQGGYDPLLNYYQWANRNTPGWYNGLSSLYAGRMDGSLPVPAVAYPDQLFAANLVPGTGYGLQAIIFPRGLAVTPTNSLRTVYPFTRSSTGQGRQSAGNTSRAFSAPRSAPTLSAPSVPAGPRITYGSYISPSIPVVSTSRASQASQIPRITYFSPPPQPPALASPGFNVPITYNQQAPHNVQNVTHAGANHPAGAVGRAYTPVPAFTSHGGGNSMSHTQAGPAHTGGGGGHRR